MGAPKGLTTENGRKPSKFKELEIGSVLTGTKGDKYEVLSSEDSHYYLVRFLKTGVKQIISAPQAKQVFDRSVPFIEGVGYMNCGDNPLQLSDKKVKDIYLRWMNMIHRCYNKAKRFKRYQNVTVCEEWHNFYNFYLWANEQPFLLNKMWQLDKDLFSQPDHKMYSPETCCFVPNGINAQIVNIKYDEIHDPRPNEHMHRICEHMSRLLLASEDNLADRVKTLLWNVCTVNGYSRESVILKKKYEEEQRKNKDLEKEVERLNGIKTAYEKKDFDSQYLQRLFPTMPVRGYIELCGKLYRIDSAKDLYNTLNLARQTMLDAQRPANVPPPTYNK